VPNLPFQPEEEECLDNIVNKASEFKQSIASLMNPLMSTPDELPVQRFYLRKIEGADVLLAHETNFLRQELHKWAPVAPEAPKLIDVSLSTRKPRPTKQQKLMAQLGITNPDDLPEHLRPKQPGIKKKEKEEKKSLSTSKNSSVKGGNATDSHTPPGLPHGMPRYESESRPSTAVPNEQDRHSVFSYDAMGGGATTTYAQQDSPMFATSGHHAMTHAGSISPVATTSSHAAGIDPQLENMFGQPSGSMGTRAAIDPIIARSHHFQTSGPHEDRSDPMALDLFGNLFNSRSDGLMGATDDPSETPFPGAFSTNSTFEDGIEEEYD
jgi:histone demethylase JARID1